MAAYNSIDLDRLALGAGEGRRFDLEVDPGELELGGQAYALAPDPVPARLDVSRTAAGHALRLRFAGRMDGPCTRCLGEATIQVEVEAREVDQPQSGDEELRSPYVAEGELDLAGWAHDALALAVPTKVPCRADCAGLCPVCGESLNDAPSGAHNHERPPDPRWEKLRGLQLE